MKISTRLKSIFIILLGLYLTLSTTLVYFLTSENRIAHIVIGMGLGLILLWVILCGSLMYIFRDRVKSVVQGNPIHWQVKFIIFGILMACSKKPSLPP